MNDIALLVIVQLITVITVAGTMFALVAPGNATIAPAFTGFYTQIDLGSPGLPGQLGGINFLAGDLNTLIVGGDANGSAGAIYTVPVIRGWAVTSPRSAVRAFTRPRPTSMAV